MRARTSRACCSTVAGLALLLLVSTAAAEQGSFVGWYVDKLQQESSTTSLRREDKAVVPARAARHFLDQLQARFGSLALRDTPPAGRVNLTTTSYINTGNRLPDLLGLDSIPEGSISPKIRIRSYQTRKEQGGKVKAAPVTDGISLMEIKMPHPVKPGVSLKPRLFVNNAHLRLLLKKKTFEDPATRDAVVQTLKADRRNDPEVVDRMVGVLGGLHRVHRGKRLRPWVQTRYQRNAFLIPIPGGGDVQVTVDRDVVYRHPRKGKVLKRMPSSWRAVEVKIPEAYASLSDGQLRAKGLGMIAEVRGLQRRVLASSQVRGLTPGKGKCNAFKKMARGRAQRLGSRDHWK